MENIKHKYTCKEIHGIDASFGGVTIHLSSEDGKALVVQCFDQHFRDQFRIGYVYDLTLSPLPPPKEVLEAEHKAKAEAEHKAKAEAEHKAKAEAEHKAKAEAEHKAKAEAEHKAKAEAEHKAKAEEKK